MFDLFSFDKSKSQMSQLRKGENMALITCPECKKKISDSAGNCPNCGFELTPDKIEEIKKKEEKSQKGCRIGCLAVIAIIGILYLVNSFSSSNSNSSKKSSRTSTSYEVVKNSEWDASVSQVKSWLKANLKDPSSIKYIEWSTVSKTDDGGFMVRVKYRAKNSFGGFVVENKVFIMNSSGTVLSNIDYGK